MWASQLFDPRWLLDKPRVSEQPSTQFLPPGYCVEEYRYNSTQPWRPSNYLSITDTASLTRSGRTLVARDLRVHLSHRVARASDPPLYSGHWLTLRAWNTAFISVRLFFVPRPRLKFGSYSFVKRKCTVLKWGTNWWGVWFFIPFPFFLLLFLFLYSFYPLRNGSKENCTCWV